ncbi:MAG: hypothetical protein ACXADH_12710 [Candidatus Kariarchaeaceae archaeon]|jgi:hypothetical protein
MMLEEFTDIEVIKGDRKVTWEYLGEGWCGDYDPDDPEDNPLLRFSCDELIDGDWEQMDNGSYCTRMPTNSPKEYLLRGAGIILEAIADICYKKRLEELSWFCPEDFEKSA